MGTSQSAVARLESGRSPSLASLAQIRQGDRQQGRDPVAEGGLTAPLSCSCFVLYHARAGIEEKTVNPRVRRRVGVAGARPAQRSRRFFLSDQAVGPKIGLKDGFSMPDQPLGQNPRELNSTFGVWGVGRCCPLGSRRPCYLPIKGAYAPHVTPTSRQTKRSCWTVPLQACRTAIPSLPRPEAPFPARAPARAACTHARTTVRKMTMTTTGTVKFFNTAKGFGLHRAGRRRQGHLRPRHRARSRPACTRSTRATRSASSRSRTRKGSKAVNLKAA